MKIIADFHVHSKYSRATARELDLEHLYIAAQIKGLQVVGTGDFSHPAWFDEIRQKLEPAEPGLFTLKSDIAGACDRQVPPACRAPVRFTLVTEISNIYKKDGQTRKNHNLVFVPDIDTAARINYKLEQIGNIRSDGRPILGLDARDLLELVLETSADAFLVPAHIWTPWFSMLGSKSGFNSPDECFGDLSSQVFAAETGLSSDPAMNWRVSSLDGLTLISNSDAHSPANLGREANLFDTELSLDAMRNALRSGDPQQFWGTIEFYPEEGKYHLDGHRKCGLRLKPRQTRNHQGLCPECGKPLTIGVLHRVEELADRAPGIKPLKAHPYRHVIPLMDILAEIMQVGSKSQKVVQAYRSAIENLGAEYSILLQMGIEEIESARIPLLAEAVRRMRADEVDILAGFDGQYGQIRIFSPSEREQIQGQRLLFEMPAAPSVAPSVTNRFAGPPRMSPAPAPISARSQNRKTNAAESLLDRLNPEQRRAVMFDGARLLIEAGPGTGKTHTLTCRMAHCIAQQAAAPQNLLALAFTRHAAEEMGSRLSSMLGASAVLPKLTTFHGLCLELLREWNPERCFAVISEDEQLELIGESSELASESGLAVELKPQKLREAIMRAKQSLIAPPAAGRGAEASSDSGWGAVYRIYQELLTVQRLVDFEDLILEVVKRLEEDATLRNTCRRRFRHIFVDEYQDLNHGQYRLIRALAGAQSAEGSLTVIGDPDQCIYGFRGSDPSYFRKFTEDYDDAGVFKLTRNYRSTTVILQASQEVMRRPDHSLQAAQPATDEAASGICVLGLPSEQAEAQAVTRIIGELVGGTGYHCIDTGRITSHSTEAAMGYADFAVLARRHDQLQVVAKEFSRAGIPFQLASRVQRIQRRGLRELICCYKLINAAAGFADFERLAAVWQSGLKKNEIRTFTRWCLKHRLRLDQGLESCNRFPVAGLPAGRQLQLKAFVDQLLALVRTTEGMDAFEKWDHLSRQPVLSELLADEDARQAVSEISELAKEAGPDAAGLLARAALLKDTDFFHLRAQKVALMTMHAAKGLEFPVVFIVGCEAGLVPFQRRGADPQDPEEERRLFYVAMTRARQRLYLTWARTRRVFGKPEDRSISPFVSDIGENLIQVEKAQLPQKKKRQQQLPLF